MKTVLGGWVSDFDTKNRFIGQVESAVLAPALTQVLLGARGSLAAVCPDSSCAEKLATQLEELKDLLEGEYGIHLFPETERDKSKLLPENESLRLRTLHQISSTPDSAGCIVVSTASSFLGPLPAPDRVRNESLILETGMEIQMEKLLSFLVEMDYDDEYEVTAPGEFSRRGGIVDIFSPAQECPARIEFLGEKIESIRLFSAETQLSTGNTDRYAVTPRNYASGGAETSSLADYLGKNWNLALVFPERCRLHLERFADETTAEKWNSLVKEGRMDSKTFFLLDEIESDNYEDSARCQCFPHTETGDSGRRDDSEAAAGALVQQLVAENIGRWLDTGYAIYLSARNEAGEESIREWCRKFELPAKSLSIGISPLGFGFIIPVAKIVVLTEKDLYFSDTHHRFPELPAFTGHRFSGGLHQQFSEIEEGDYVAHTEYGVGIFRGIRYNEGEGRKNEMFRIEFADEVTLDIPLWQANAFSRYFGTGKAVPKLSRIGASKWRRSKTEAALAVKGLAAQMLHLQAIRMQKAGFQFPLDDKSQRLFEESFPFQDTPDQKKAAEEVKADMCSERPMDRLVCGDVGFGKTEVAARAAFKAICAGKQVAILVPTTVLAQQHFYTFSERFAEFPVLIEMLSRFRTEPEQREILKRLAEGKIDIVIGTHRLIQHDVQFARLGLLIIDEEQRFGVEAKEKLKRLRATVDILTLTATPIPRTLYMSIAGVRDLSAIMTPPELRLPIKTIVCRHDEKIVVPAIEAELERGGQVYYVHNRVQSIEKTAFRLQNLLPAAKFAVAHGKMNPGELEMIMGAFLDGKIDVLVCTTIIQSGIDIPNANTMLVERADRFGLAELYQLRGRVGRWTRQAFAYMLLPPKTNLEGNARERIAAIRRYTQLGAGFRLALRDLEIRGAGNLLGHEQSGHINAVGFELYCSLLKRAVEEMRKGSGKLLPEVSLFIDFLDFAHETAGGRIPAAIPPEYIPSEKLRIDFYRRIAKIEDHREFDGIRSELEDRFGKIPVQIINLLRFFRIRLDLARANAISLSTRGREITLRMLPSEKRRKSEYLVRFSTDDPIKKFSVLEKLSREIKDSY